MRLLEIFLIYSLCFHINSLKGRSNYCNPIEDNFIYFRFYNNAFLVHGLTLENLKWRDKRSSSLNLRNFPRSCRKTLYNCA